MADFKNFSFREINKRSGELRTEIAKRKPVFLEYYNKPYAVVITVEEYERLTGTSFANLSFKESSNGKKRKK